jgi:pimeloyl-ACP methyl ester carboxylesterase
MAIDKGTESRQASSREGEVAGGGLNFGYRERGSGEAVLWLGHLDTWPVLWDRLAQQRRIVELLRPERSMPTNAQATEALTAIMTALAIDRFDLIARGDDAALALVLALEHPQKMRSLILLGPTMLTASGQLAAGVDGALAVRLGTLTVPSLAVFGTRDAYASPEAGRHYRARLATCNVVFVYDAGHDMGAERPDAVGELVLDFLERRDLFLVRDTDDLLYP